MNVGATNLEQQNLTQPNLAQPDIAFDNSYARLPERFFVPAKPAKTPEPKLVHLNAPLARWLGLDPDWLAGPDGVDFLSGNKIAKGANPIAMAYAGHQFGGFSPSLGDGRAILLGELVGRDGQRHDLQLKGAGKTPFSRGGDGRAVLGPMLREYLVSEAMAALCVPTTRALGVLLTGDLVMREGYAPGALLVRVAKSHVRVGTFQYFAARSDYSALQTLTDYVIARHYPSCAQSENPGLALLENVIARQANLIAHWQSLGFIHGVMNTDNVSIAGETLDYGPCAFMDVFERGRVFSSIDQQGRYAYANQPAITQWNLAVFAQTLLPLLHQNEKKAVELAQTAIDAYPALFEASYLNRMRAKLGLATATEGDADLVVELLGIMQKAKADFTLTFRQLSDRLDPGSQSKTPANAAADPFADWQNMWRARVVGEGRDKDIVLKSMNAANPAYIPRNHLVEASIRAAEDEGDFAPFHDLRKVLERPFEAQPGREMFAKAPLESEIVHQTFCGT